MHDSRRAVPAVPAGGWVWWHSKWLEKNNILRRADRQLMFYFSIGWGARYAVKKRKEADALILAKELMPHNPDQAKQLIINNFLQSVPLQHAAKAATRIRCLGVAGALFVPLAYVGWVKFIDDD